MWSPLLLVPLLAIQLHGAGATISAVNGSGGTEGAAVQCNRDYIHVARTSEIKAAEGCYRREIGSGSNGGAAVYVKDAANEGGVYQATVSKVCVCC